MRHRKWFLFLLLVLLIALGGGYLALRPGPPDVNLIAKSKQIQVGMSLDELKALLGNPTGFGQLVNKPVAIAVWESGETELRVMMDGQLKVTSKTCGTRSLGRRLDQLFSKMFSPPAPAPAKTVAPQ